MIGWIFKGYTSEEICSFQLIPEWLIHQEALAVRGRVVQVRGVLGGENVPWIDPTSRISEVSTKVR